MEEVEPVFLVEVGDRAPVDGRIQAMPLASERVAEPLVTEERAVGDRLDRAVLGAEQPAVGEARPPLLEAARREHHAVGRAAHLDVPTVCEDGAHTSGDATLMELSRRLYAHQAPEGAHEVKL